MPQRVALLFLNQVCPCVLFYMRGHWPLADVFQVNTLFQHQSGQYHLQNEQDVVQDFFALGSVLGICDWYIQGWEIP